MSRMEEKIGMDRVILEKTDILARSKRDYPVGIGLAIIHLGALGVFIPAFFSWQAVGLAIGWYSVTALGITLGFHRLLTHRSLVVPKYIEYAIAILGTLALQGGPIEWVAQHRAHHANADTHDDPHDANRGMWWAHIEWMFRRNPSRVAVKERARWAPDLIKDPFYRMLDRLSPILTILLGLIFLAVGGWSWVIWGIFARLVFTYHCTWLVNSASHGVGYRRFQTEDLSTNNWWVALLTFGEGWHNNHHAFPFSARHGLHWFEFDPTYWTIKVMSWMNLASKIKIPTQDMIERLEIKHQKAA